MSACRSCSQPQKYFGDLKNAYAAQSRSDQSKKRSASKTKGGHSVDTGANSSKKKAKLEHLLRQANKDRPGKKIKADDLVLFALDLITEQHLSEICNKTLSNKDRMEPLYRKIAKEKRGITRDEFFGMLLDGKLAH